MWQQSFLSVQTSFVVIWTLVLVLVLVQSVVVLFGVPPPPPSPPPMLRPSLVCAVCLCVLQVRAASTVTSWSNQTPTALPTVPPPLQDQQVQRPPTWPPHTPVLMFTDVLARRLPPQWFQITNYDSLKILSGCFGASVVTCLHPQRLPVSPVMRSLSLSPSLVSPAPPVIGLIRHRPHVCLLVTTCMLLWSRCINVFLIIFSRLKEDQILPCSAPSFIFTVGRKSLLEMFRKLQTLNLLSPPSPSVITKDQTTSHSASSFSINLI